MASLKWRSSMSDQSGSSTTSATPGLFDGVLAHGVVRMAVSDRAWLRALLDTVAALAKAHAAVGLISGEVASVVVRVCDQPGRFDVARLAVEAAEYGDPVLPLVYAVEARAALPHDARYAVQGGATSQDIMDTATMLVARRAIGPLLADLNGAADAAARLAQYHRDVQMVGRTQLQHAVPTTFGLKAAGWLVALDEMAGRLAALWRTRLAVQFGGAAGTLNGYGPQALEVMAALARELRLAEPLLPWHTDRTRIADLAGALGTAAGVASKVACDVILLAQTEVGEVIEGGPGGSPAMPHERRPVAAVCCGGVRRTGAWPGGDPAGRDGARAGGGQRRLAGRVAAAARAVRRGRLGGVVAAPFAGRADPGQGRDRGQHDQPAGHVRR
jgi:3-carboxy-cis,cis-muconate cycloisomerase